MQPVYDDIYVVRLPAANRVPEVKGKTGRHTICNFSDKIVCGISKCCYAMVMQLS